MRSGWILFAVTVFVIVAVMDIIWGLTAILNADWLFFSATGEVWYINISAWGWITLIIGLVGLVVAWGIYGGQTWARIVGIIVAGIAAINAFVIIPYFPVWGIVITAAWVLAIWALAVHGDEVPAA